MAELILKQVMRGPGFRNINEKAFKTTKRLAITSAQLKTLNSVPVAIAAAPGAGKALVLEYLTFQYTYGTVQYTGGGVVKPVYHGQTTDLTVTGGLAAATILAAANALYACFVNPAAGGLSLLSNTGLDLTCATADFAAGDGTLIVNVAYYTIDLG